MTEEVTNDFDEKYGWPNVIFDYETALELFNRFGKKYSFNFLEIGINENDAENFIDKMTPKQPDLTKYSPVGESGCLIKLKQKEKITEDTFLGYELIDAEYNNLTHSFLCNGIEKDFVKDINKNNLFDSYEIASDVCKKINTKEINAEPGYWFPIGIYKKL